MARRDSAPPEAGRARDERSINARIQQQREHLYDTQAMIFAARNTIDQDEDQSVYRILTMAWDRIERVAVELDHIGSEANEVAHE